MNLAAIAQQLKSPLGIVAGYLEVLLSERTEPLTEQQRRILQEARESTDRLLALAQDVLTCGRLDSEAISLNLEMGDLNLCLSEVCRYWHDRFVAKGVMLYSPPNPNLPPVEFDVHKIQQVASNLLDNALKFTPPGGTVWLTARPCVSALLLQHPGPNPSDLGKVPSRPPNAVRVTLTDTGPGIAPEFFQDVFEDFFQIPGMGKSEDGFGLGLAIARRIVQAHGSRIWVESEIGTGSSFHFLLPLQREHTEASESHEKVSL